MTPTSGKPDRVTVLFGGGGVKAAAHVGAWRAIAEAGLSPSHYFGTSMGAVIAACFSAGLSFEEVRQRIAAVKRRDVARTRRLLPLRGLSALSVFYLEPLRAAIERMVPVRTFRELPAPLTVTAVDLDSGALTLFGSGGRDVPLVDALLASCALPVFYPPVVIGGRRFADGGVRAVLPLGPAALIPADLLIAVNTGAGFDEEATASPTMMPALLRAHNSATGILMAANTETELALYRLSQDRPRLIYVRPRVEKHVTFRVDLAEKYVEEGHRATREKLAGSGLGARGSGL